MDSPSLSRPSLSRHRRVATAASRPVARTLHVVVVAALIAGAVGYAATHRTVALSVDGVSRQVATTASTVRGVLDEAGVSVGARDVVAPGLDETIADGGEIVVRYARPLRLVVDGQQRTIWTTARTVAEALADTDLRLAGARLSVSRSAPLGRQGLTVDVALRKQVSIAVDGEHHVVTTTGRTVLDALTVAGVTLGGSDRVTPRPGEALVDGAQVAVTRIRTARSTTQVPIRFGTVRRPTGDLAQGMTRVIRAGRPGLKVLSYVDTWTDGRLTGRRLVGTEVRRRQVDALVSVGTRVTYRSASVGGSVPRSVSSLNWDALARCESGGNPRAVSPSGSFYGLYQFLVSTWRSVGGSGLPTQASAAEQTMRAQLVYQRAGASQWPACGSRLFS